jgi:D-aspartate ligase
MNAVAVDLKPKSVSTQTPASSRKSRGVGAVVMDADYRGLAVVRSLGRRGIPVWVVQHGDQLVATLSHYNRRTLSWPSHDEEEMAKFLVNLADREAIRDWVLFPTGDEAAAFVARHHVTLAQHFQLTTPPWEVLRWSHDKRLAYKLADSVGVDHPWTLCPESRDQIATSKCQFPVILKPAFNSGFNRFTASKAWRVDSMEQLLHRYDEAKALVGTDNLMIQELIPGGGESQFSYTTLCKDGQSLASLSARRIRQYPMDFGRASTFVETIDDPSIAAAAERLIAALRYTGLVEVEFKRDHRDGKLKLLDINPRVWGWHSLCGFAGVDYPYLLWLLTTGEPVPQIKAMIGARWVRMSTDAPTAIREILHGRLSLREYLRSIRPPLAPAIFASDDPLPGILELPLIAYLAGKRVFRGNGIV